MKVKINNEIPERWKNNKFLKGFSLVVGAILILSSIATTVIKIFCADDSVAYQAIGGSDNILNLILGSALLYFYILLKQRSNS